MVLKKSMLALLLVGLVQHQTHAGSFESSLESIKDTTITVGIVAACAGVSYLVGRASSALVFSLATSRFGSEISLLNHQWLIGNHTELKKQVKESLLIYHENHLLSSGVYRNYPLMRYMDDLDWYISRLRLLQLFHLGTEQCDKIRALVSQLQFLRSLISSDYEFIKERRKFEESTAIHITVNNNR